MQRRAPSYRDNGDGTTTDLNTGLTWVQARGSKTTFAAALAGAATCRVGGHSDWRMPTIKELYSLILFSGKNGQGFTSTAGFVPFLDTRYFGFAYGSGIGTERVIDCQDWSATEYVCTTMNGDATVFGVNFADGRIKGYPKYQPGSGGSVGQSMYVRYVRGNPAYGVNDFVDNGDGTVTDRATGLMWSRADSGTGMNWQEALAWVQAKNAEKHLGHDDWRLADRQGAAEHRRLHAALPTRPDLPPSTRSSTATAITNEGGARDWPFYWSSTTFIDGTPNSAAAYLAFGRGLGWMERPTGSGSYTLLDVHGAGTQRGDPKAGDPASWPHGFGPQGDVIRIRNHVRLVRDATASGATATLFLPIVLDVTGRARYTTELTLANREHDRRDRRAALHGGRGVRRAGKRHRHGLASRRPPARPRGRRSGSCARSGLADSRRGARAGPSGSRSPTSRRPTPPSPGSGSPRPPRADGRASPTSRPSSRSSRRGPRGSTGCGRPRRTGRTSPSRTPRPRRRHASARSRGRQRDGEARRRSRSPT